MMLLSIERGERSLSATATSTFIAFELGAVLAAALFPTSQAATAIFAFPVHSLTSVFAPVSSGSG
jgi:hypothetical protein